MCFLIVCFVVGCYSCNLDGIWSDIDDLCSTVVFDGDEKKNHSARAFKPKLHAAQQLSPDGHNYAALQARINAWNLLHKYKKRAICALPLKYPISFTPVMMNKGHYYMLFSIICIFFIRFVSLLI